jgi:hypothetical protein
MFKVKVKERIKEYCKDQIARYNFGMRSQANATPEQQYTGILGLHNLPVQPNSSMLSRERCNI